MIRFITPVPLEGAGGLVGEVYRRVRRDFGVLAEPFPLHSPLPELLAGSWCALRETLLAGHLERPLKELVAAVVSRANRCPYCVEAHTTMLEAAGYRGAAWGVRLGRRRLGAERFDAYARWAAATGDPDHPDLAEPPFPPEAGPEVRGTACCFHYVNRLATVFLGPGIVPLPGRWLRAGALAAVAGRLRPRVQPGLPAGESLDLLPEAAAPPESWWAEASPPVAGALGRWFAATAEAGREALSEAARRRVKERVALWRGEPLPFGSSWVEEALDGLVAEDRPGARLALLAALAPHRVGHPEIAAFRCLHPGDRHLLGAAAWGAAQATLRVSSWLAPGEVPGRAGGEATQSVGGPPAGPR
ncbi:MAG TPA: carboxymuconolactone decarboxylase family protein [Thermoanaerobaculia bacterium]|nr:carboxymuconolactone decarboxylase family protein [Thermoanaerobaculia bacterium]